MGWKYDAKWWGMMAKCERKACLFVRWWSLVHVSADVLKHGLYDMVKVAGEHARREKCMYMHMTLNDVGCVWKTWCNNKMMSACYIL